MTPSGGRPPSRSRRPRGAFLAWLFAGLVVLALFQGFVLFPALFSEDGDGRTPETPEMVLPRRSLRVFCLEGDPVFILKTPFDLPAADASERAALDARLFPSGPPHRYYFLEVVNRTEQGIVLDLRKEPVILVGRAGRRFPPVDLEEALRTRARGIPAYLVTWLRLQIPREGRLEVASASRATVLLAYPAEAALPEIREVRIGRRTLIPATVRKDELDGRLSSIDGVMRAKKP